jgi:DNA primase
MTTTNHHYHKNNEELTDLLDLVDPEDFLIWLGVDYQMTRGRSGVQLNIKECPRCGGAERKVYLNAESGLGNCFHGSCVDEPGYNLFSFTRAFFEGDAKETVAQLKNYAATVGWKPKKKAPLTQSVKAAGAITLPKSYAIPINGKNLSYLQTRGISIEIATELGLRFCKQGGFDYTAPDGNKRRQDYSGRVIVPVRDLQGEVRTFQGRDITGTAERRYLFPPGLAGTGQFLFNAHNALNCETLIIAEGVFDVAATLMALKDDHTQSCGVVGSFGKRISMSAQGEEDQLSQLYKLRESGTKQFIFLWDGDLATLNDACDEALQLRRYGFDTYIAMLPAGKDPNEVPASVVRQAINAAHQATTMKVNAIKMRLRATRA